MNEHTFDKMDEIRILNFERELGIRFYNPVTDINVNCVIFVASSKLFTHLIIFCVQ